MIRKLRLTACLCFHRSCLHSCVLRPDFNNSPCLSALAQQIFNFLFSRQLWRGVVGVGGRQATLRGSNHKLKCAWAPPSPHFVALYYRLFESAPPLLRGIFTSCLLLRILLFWQRGPLWFKGGAPAAVWCRSALSAVGCDSVVWVRWMSWPVSISADSLAG